MPEPVRYVLGDFPPQKINWENHIPLIGKAQSAIAKYDGVLNGLPDSRLLYLPLVIQEAVLSSKIEGTNVSIIEVLKYEADSKTSLSDTKRYDAEEVMNYRNALNYASKQIEERPFHLNLLRETHKILLDSVRGQDKNPGSFRETQNWIGVSGCPIEQATFVPIGIENLAAGIDTWKEYYRNTEVLDPLVQLAIIHLEFEALHPFSDGNGRIGRILIPLFLFERGILSKPNFYMSEFLERNRDSYIEKMRTISATRDWNDWCDFFLKGIVEQSSNNLEKANSILDLYHHMLKLIAEIRTYSQNIGEVIDFLFSQPVFTISQLSDFTKISKSSVSRIVKLLHDQKLIETLRESKGRNAKLYIFQALLEITEKI